jgi:hypothetical protein
MHAVFSDLTRASFLAFRPTHEDIPESVASTIISSAASSDQLSRSHSFAIAAASTSTSSAIPEHDPRNRNSALRHIFLGMDPDDVDIDWSCLDDLDEQLRYHPMHSFVAACWAEATDHEESEDEDGDEDESIRTSQPQTRYPLAFFRRTPSKRSLALDDRSFLSHSDSTATPTIGLWAEMDDPDNDDETISIDSLHHTRVRNDPHRYLYPTYMISPVNRRRSQDGPPVDDDDDADPPSASYPAPTAPAPPPFRDDPWTTRPPPSAALDGYFTGCDPKDAIHFYPVSPLARQLRAQPDRDRKRANNGLGRLTAFCATLPRRLIPPPAASAS